MLQIFDERPEEENFEHAVPLPSNSTVSSEDSFTKCGTGIGTRQEHCDIEHAVEMRKKDREETVHITGLLQNAISSSGLTGG